MVANGSIGTGWYLHPLLLPELARSVSLKGAYGVLLATHLPHASASGTNETKNKPPRSHTILQPQGARHAPPSRQPYPQACWEHDAIASHAPARLSHAAGDLCLEPRAQGLPTGAEAGAPAKANTSVHMSACVCGGDGGGRQPGRYDMGWGRGWGVALASNCMDRLPVPSCTHRLLLQQKDVLLFSTRSSKGNL